MLFSLSFGPLSNVHSVKGLTDRAAYIFVVGNQIARFNFVNGFYSLDTRINVFHPFRGCGAWGSFHSNVALFVVDRP